MKQIIEQYKKDAERWNTIVGMVLSLIGIVISIITAVKDPSDFCVAVSITICQLIVVLFCGISLQIIDNSKKAIKECQESMKSSDQNTKDEIEQITTRLNQFRVFAERLAVFEKNINKKINNFVTLICDNSDIYYHNITILIDQAKRIDRNNTKEILQNEKQQQAELVRFQEELFSLYNRYITGTFEELTKVLGFYLPTTGMPLGSKVSVSLKLFDATYIPNGDINSIKIITAFRDKETYEAKEREIGKKHYTIAGNCDFQQCLTKESYIRNNIQDGLADYANENYPNSLRYYNSTVVVPIISDYKSEKNFFGFLCCDTMNTDPEVKPFDKRAADIMYAAALTIGMFFDNANACWDYIEAFEKKEFLTFIHDKCYTGR